MIQQGGTMAIFKLRVYPDNATNITNKTPYRAETSFQLNENDRDGYKTTPDGKVMIIRGENRQIAGTAAMSGQNSTLQAILDGQNKMYELMAKMLQQKENDRMDKLIGFLEQKAQAPVDTPVDKLMNLGQMIVEKPDIIDRIGYIFRPNIYQRLEEPMEQPISGTTAKEAPKQEEAMEETQEPATELTDEQHEALCNRLDAAMDIIEEHTRLELLVEIMEALAKQKPEKLRKLTADKLNSAFTFL